MSKSQIYFYLRVNFALHKKMKFCIKDFFSKCDQIRRNLQIWLHLLKKSLMQNLIFYAMINLTGLQKTNFEKAVEFLTH